MSREYCKSRNIILSQAVHILNITFSSILTITAGTDNLVYILGGQTIVYVLFALTSIGSVSLFDMRK